MYDGYSLVALLMGIGTVLVIAELLLPSHGLLGIGAGCCILGAIFFAARQSPWAGLALLLAVAVATPFAWVAFVKIWPRTPIGRRVVLPPVESDDAPAVVTVGQSGVTVSELRPMGTCDFDGVRCEAMSEHGPVPPGRSVRVVALVNHRPTVRAT